MIRMHIVQNVPFLPKENRIFLLHNQRLNYSADSKSYHVVALCENITEGFIVVYVDPA